MNGDRVANLFHFQLAAYFQAPDFEMLVPRVEFVR